MWDASARCSSKNSSRSWRSGMRLVILVVPVIQLIVIGYAVTTDVRHVPTAIYDLDNSVASRERLVAEFTGSDTSTFVARITNDRQMVGLLDTAGDVVLRFPHGFGRGSGTRRAGRGADGSRRTDSNTASGPWGNASQILAATTRTCSSAFHTAPRPVSDAPAGWPPQRASCQ